MAANIGPYNKFTILVNTYQNSKLEIATDVWSNEVAQARCSKPLDFETYLQVRATLKAGLFPRGLKVIFFYETG